MFALVDCNNFYASCERVFNPAITTRPVVVLSNNDGCIIARSNEAKALGFKMGDPYFRVRKEIQQHGVAVFSSNYALYGDMSRRVMETLERFSPEVEIYSIDEAFLNLAGFASETLLPVGADIRRTVRQWTGIPVSVGIGPTKTLAKAANQLAKRLPASGGVFALVTPEQRLESLSRLPIGDVWGIGRQWTRFLESQGVGTALAFSQQPDRWIRQHLNVLGLRTAAELRGIACIPLELAPPPKKGLCVSRSFGRKLTDLGPIQEALVAYATRAGEKLRRERLLACHLEVFLQSSRFAAKDPYYSNAASLHLPFATSDTAELIQHACAGLQLIFRPGYAYAKCGVMLTELVEEGSEQRDLLDTRDCPRRAELMQAIDQLNRRLGRDTVFFAGSGIRRGWKAFANMKSQSFTTQWRQFLQIRAGGSCD